MPNLAWSSPSFVETRFRSTHPAWMTFEPMGISDQIVRRAIRECRVDPGFIPSVAGRLSWISHLDEKNILFGRGACGL